MISVSGVCAIMWVEVFMTIQNDANALAALRTPTERWLQRHFPRAPAAAIADAVAEAILTLLTRPSRVGDRLPGLIRTIAWRVLRRVWQQARRELSGSELDHACGDPLARLEARAALRRLAAARDEAVERFGGRMQAAFGRALDARLAGTSDAEAARLHGVRRESINRARRWMLTRV